MARQDRAAPESGARSNLYDDITNTIIAELEQGRLPWVQPWGTAAAKAPLAMPRNATTSRHYSGINVLILWGAVIQHGFPTQNWLTFRQALSLGGNVRKGERGTTVVYADRFTPEDEKRRARETGEEPGRIPFLKRFTVFNAAQCEGLPEEIAVDAPPPPPGLTGTQRDRLLANGRQRDQDHIPVVKFFNPFGAGVWLATELDEDGDIMFGLADLGSPELGSWSLEELSSVRLPFGMGIERDLLFTGDFPISLWAEAARETGSIRSAERLLYRVGASFSRTSADTESRGS